jgi:Spy/CpxP family protein refolding chaperone
MNLIRKIVCVWGLIFGLLSVNVSFAQDQDAGMDKSASYGKMHEWREKKIQNIYAQLNLSDAQKKTLEENKATSRQKMKSVFEKMKPLRDSLNQELMKAELDMNKINEIQSQIKAVQSEIGDNRLNSILEVRKILTPEQFAKFLSLMEKSKKDRWQEK